MTDTEGRLLGPFGLMLISPAIGAAVQQLGAALRFDKILPTRTRELAILAIAAHRQSQFEWLAHENAARAAGITDLQLQALLDGEEPKGLEEAELTAFRVVNQLLANGELDDEGYVRAESILGTESVAVIVWLVGYYEMLATALATFRPPLHAKDQK
ncbi:carboxymuconolactone decarboxylase family protein [Rhodococcus sp. IEGM 1304]|uniref:carboxymuconolactone decarboxylase family protein n=1 Tax=Rhodococcus sp. IEGM 1304 TaxID=3082227 RepID=UPI0029534BA9|nr:carboxymuconolactone decarboxylase family protein [Rhodococcus sp. IEGM 1304]MDV8128850.1 carboxymuconolactone decarboxylase family protein [Rhodococcus sp. IEGM 1304]